MYHQEDRGGKKDVYHINTADADLERVASESSDTEFAEIVQNERLKLFRSFARSLRFPLDPRVHVHRSMRED